MSVCQLHASLGCLVKTHKGHFCVDPVQITIPWMGQTASVSSYLESLTILFEQFVLKLSDCEKNKTLICPDFGIIIIIITIISSSTSGTSSSSSRCASSNGNWLYWFER